MKRKIDIVTFMIVAVVFFIPIFIGYEVLKSHEQKPEPIYISNTARVHENVSVNEEENRRKEVQEKMNSLMAVEDEIEWFIAYKLIIEEYSDVFDSPETIYDCFNTEELDLFFRIVQAEVGDEWGFIEKANVASVILNRLYDEENFKEQDTLTKVLTTENQFSTYSNGSYKTSVVSELTILACEYAFMIEDTTDGCIAFRSDDNAPEIWCKKWKRVDRDNAGHWLYKEIEVVGD